MERIREYIDDIPFEVGDFGIAQHPLFQTFATMNVDTRELVHITDANFDTLKEQRYKLIENALSKDDGLFGMFIQIHKPYRLPILMTLYSKNLISRKEYSEALIDLWVDTEFPHQNGVSEMYIAFVLADKKYLMTPKEKKKFDKLPKTMQVFRGLQENAEKRALSWTRDKKVAIWFATRFDRKGGVLKAKIPKESVFAYKEERGEAEIILNPENLKDIVWYDYEVNENENSSK